MDEGDVDGEDGVEAGDFSDECDGRMLARPAI